MATILQTGENSYIAGDPPEALGLREHWCSSCRGDGLEYDWDDELTICMSCFGACVVECDDPECEDHTRGSRHD